MGETPAWHDNPGWNYKGNTCYRTAHISHMEGGPLQTWQLYGGAEDITTFGGNGKIGDIREHQIKDGHHKKLGRVSKMLML